MGWDHRVCAAAWLLLLTTSCDSFDEEAAQARLVTTWTPIQTRLRSTAAALPARGSIADGALAPLDPPPRYRSSLGHVFPENFDVVDVRDLSDPSHRVRDPEDDGAGRWYESRSVKQCLRLAEDPHAFVADYVDSDCRRAAALDYLVALRAIAYRGPQVDADSFVPGRVEFEAFLIRMETGVIERQFRFRAGNDEDLDFSEARETRTVYIEQERRRRVRRRQLWRRRSVPRQVAVTTRFEIADTNFNANVELALRARLAPISVDAPAEPSTP